MLSRDPLEDTRDWSSDDILRVIDRLVDDSYRQQTTGLHSAAIITGVWDADDLVGKPKGRLTLNGIRIDG